MRRYILASILVLVLNSVGYAATWYVDSACSTSGTGASETCGTTGPKKTLKEFLQGTDCAGMVSGDIIQITGNASPDLACSTGGRCYHEDNINVEGNCNNIIVQNKANTHVVFNGTQDMKNNTWTEIACGVYRCTDSGCSGDIGDHFGFHVWYNTGTGERELDLEQSNKVCDETLAPGKMRIDTTDQTICVHLHDGSNPSMAQYIQIPWYDVAIGASADSADGMTFRRNPSGTGEFYFTRYRRDIFEADPGVNTGWTIDGLHLSYAMDRCISFGDTSTVAANTQIRNNTITFCGQEGIRIGEKGAFQVYNNIVSDIQRTPMFEACYGVGTGCLSGFTDNGTGIRVLSQETGNGGLVKNNSVLRVGGGNKRYARGINLEHTNKSVTVENNYVYDIYNIGNEGYAIMFSGSLSGLHNDNVIVRNNRIYKVDYCFKVEEGSSYPSQAGKTNYILNNTCAKFRVTGFDASGTPLDGQYYIQNNIFDADDESPSRLVKIATGANYSIFENNSLECPDCPVNSDIVDWKGAKFKRAGDCTPSSNCVADMTSLGANFGGNLYGSANLDKAGDPPPTLPSLRIIPPSNAINTGKTLALVGTDWEGHTRPAGAYDIGADEIP